MPILIKGSGGNATKKQSLTTVTVINNCPNDSASVIYVDGTGKAVRASVYSGGGTLSFETQHAFSVVFWDEKDSHNASLSNISTYASEGESHLFLAKETGAASVRFS